MINKAEELFTEAIPKYMRPLAGPMKILGISQGIIAPLRVDEEDLGLLVVFGSEAISSEDEPAIDSFAGQVAISLRNARLAKQVEIELVERRLAEEAVRRTENHFRALIEKAPDGITLVGVDGKIKYTSPSARKMFGYDLDDDINESPLEHIHPDDLSSVLKAMNDLIQDPACIPTLEYRYKHKNSTYYWVESTLSNQLAEPSVQAVVINFRNITERKLIEKTLFESERYYRALIENASDGILAVDTEARIIYESPSVAHLLGYEPYTLIGTNALDLIHPTLIAKHHSGLEHTTCPPGNASPSKWKWRYFEILSHYLTNDPVIKGVIINGRDITERKQMEGALKASENRYRILYEDNPSRLYTKQTNVVSVNKFGAEQLGYTANELIGCSLFDIFHTEDRALVRERFTACLQNMEQSIQTEARKICKDGTILWVRESARGVHDSHGQGGHSYHL
ncbi:PAS domain S-box protein [Candidatus Villigracilis affinis]|uniref:PAS domain S-box protein n=1 Tax=Candidatus Villigracilis affinis TaxID=3140682 RepID=UPI001E0238FC|nr:PAS domain S-box protein [Anaerolineales bacterium]